MGRLVTIEEVKDYAGVKRDEKDSFIERLIRGSESAIERFTKRQFSPEPTLKNEGTTEDPKWEDTEPVVTKKIATYGSGQVLLPDLRVATSISFGGQMLVEDITVALSNRGRRYFSTETGQWEEEPYTFLELSALVDVIPPNWLNVDGQKDLEIRGRWGFYPTPDDIKDAVAALCARRYKRKDANWADSVQLGPGDGSSTNFNYFKALPSEIQEVLKSYTISKVAIV